MIFSILSPWVFILITLTVGVASHYLIISYWKAVLVSGIIIAILLIIAESLLQIYYLGGIKGYLILIYPEAIAVLISVLIGLFFKIYRNS